MNTPSSSEPERWKRSRSDRAQFLRLHGTAGLCGLSRLAEARVKPTTTDGIQHLQEGIGAIVHQLELLRDQGCAHAEIGRGIFLAHLHDELARTIRETYSRAMARNRGTAEAALRTCEVLLRVHRATEGREADRMRIAKMLAEEPVPDRAG